MYMQIKKMARFKSSMKQHKDKPIILKEKKYMPC